ncbi:MAG: tRNA pseudouridine(38-40) synthase TruA [Planctomycetes bacterium]|nr:tRNA pseudouridine(38-40) synthase TruA [Planctomycetota bacterium]
MERNVKLIIAYDGTEFHGWQRQRGVRTVQAEIEQVAQRVMRHPLTLVGASRTDAGVHARGQTAHLLTSATIPVQNLWRAIGQRLPADVALVHAAEVPLGFHATRDARGKLYRYRIHNATARPTTRLAARHTWHVWFSLDPERMRAAAAALTGTHDFAAFASSGCTRASTVRTVRRVSVRRVYDEIVIDVEGAGFLYNQVRNMVGTLFEVGRGHWPVERVAEIIAARDRRQAGPTAPAQGLCLQWVQYGCDRGAADGA